MASGVHGIIDFTVPAGGSSLSDSICRDGGLMDDRRDLGSMKRILVNQLDQIEKSVVRSLTCGKDYSGT